MSDAVEPDVPASGAEEKEEEASAGEKLLGGRYRLIRRLGKGGMGEVFLAQHATIEKHVAIKILLPERAKQENQKARFLNEAKATAKVRHANVIDISDFGETDDGRAFFVMEHLVGEDLKKYCRRQHILPWKDIELILLQICSGLGAAHKQGIIHRDLKPDNVFLIEHQGIANFVKVLDFGLAKMLDDDSSKKLTKTGIIVGTPAFLSPEQIKGDPVDARADIYALGLILYRMLCGQLPFKAKTVVDMLRKQLMEKPLPPSAMAPDAPISPAADQVALKALEKDPQKRYQSTMELGQAIADVHRNPGGVQIAVPGAIGAADSSKPQLEIVEVDEPSEGELVLPLARQPHVTGPHTPSGRTPSGAQQVTQAVADDGVITPEDASQSFRSQLLSRPEEVSAQLRRQEQQGRGIPVMLIVLITIVLGAIVAAILMLR
jgi:serine/threonine protein kinase